MGIYYLHHGNNNLNNGKEPLVTEHGNKKKHVKFDDFRMYPGVEEYIFGNFVVSLEKLFTNGLVSSLMKGKCQCLEGFSSYSSHV